MGHIPLHRTLRTHDLKRKTRDLNDYWSAKRSNNHSSVSALTLRNR